MMNKYTHHLSVAFVVCLEKFPIISHKKSLPEIRFSYRTWGGVFYGVLDREHSIYPCLIYTQKRGQTWTRGIKLDPSPMSVLALSVSKTRTFSCRT